MLDSVEPTSEDLLADALAAFDAGGESALQSFVSAHPTHFEVLQRGIARCRQMGLLSAPTSRAFPEQLDGFRLVRKIGGGGMGVVYEAENASLGRPVALKLIRPELLYFEGSRERFRREVDAIAKLAHPAIVPVIASGEPDGLPYFVMELLPGATVEEILQRCAHRDPNELHGEDLHVAVAPSSASEHGSSHAEVFTGAWWKACVRLGIQVALGLRHAHLRGIVHRDIKPSNIMVTPHGQAIVLDFGVAKTHAAQELTRAGATPGSPAFMSPEQLRAEATDERTDIYSLAATIWNLLTLLRPFGGTKLLEEIQRGHLRPLRHRNRNVPRELELVLRTAMDLDRERRYGDMGAFAADLQAVLARKPIRARPLAPWLRVLRWSQRHRVVATALVATLCLGFVLTLALAWQQNLAHHALQKEQQRTNESLNTSLDALHHVLVKLGHEGLREVPLAEQMAHEALLDASKLFEVLLAAHPDHPRVRLLGGRAWHALAMSYERQGRFEDAEHCLSHAIAALEHADSAAALDMRACARMSQAGLYCERGALDATVEEIGKARDDFRAAAAADPSFLAASLRGQANLQTTLSIVLNEAREPERVEAALREAIALLEAAIATPPPDKKDPELEITYLGNLGKFFARRGRDEEAREVFRSALSVADRTSTVPAAGFSRRQARAEIEEGLANLLAKEGAPETEELFLRCLATRESLAQEYPNHVLWRVQWGGTLHNYGNYLWRSEERAAEARALFEKARDLQQEALRVAPGLRQAQLFLGNHLKMLGTCYTKANQGAEVLEVARELAALELPEVQAPYRAALFFLHARRLLARDPSALGGTDCVEAAIDQLLLAAQQGFDGIAELDHGFFKPLREHPRWEELRAYIAGNVRAR